MANDENTAIAPIEFGGAALEGLIAKAIEKDSPLDVLTKLNEMRKEMDGENAKRAYFAALSAFQAECPEVPKSRVAHGSKFNYNYAPLEVVVRTVSPFLTKHGLSYDLKYEQPEINIVIATCVAHHVGGHSEESVVKMPIDPEAFMNPQQQIGSAITYGKRYAFCNVFGIMTADQDDDGKGADPENAAGERKQERGQKRFGPICPKCGKNDSAMPDKYNPGSYYCYPKIGGCGHKWNPDGKAAPDPPRKQTEPTPDAPPPPKETHKNTTMFDGKTAASDKQLQFIRSLKSQLGYEDAEFTDRLNAVYHVQKIHTLTAKDAGELITTLKAKLDKLPPKAKKPPKTTQKPPAKGKLFPGASDSSANPPDDDFGAFLARARVIIKPVEIADIIAEICQVKQDTAIYMAEQPHEIPPEHRAAIQTAINRAVEKGA